MEADRHLGIAQDVLQLLAVLDHPLKCDGCLGGCSQPLGVMAPFLKRKGVVWGQKSMLDGHDLQLIRLLAVRQAMESV